MKHLKIAVDGPAGSGKSSVSKEVAVCLGLQYIDSGALYRSVTWYFLENNFDIKHDTDFNTHLKNCAITQDFLQTGQCNTYVNGKDVSDLIRNEIIAKNIGIISDSPLVRNYINNLLRDFAAKKSVIMDGRDIGTVVFPDADLKIFLDASVDIRAWRRIREYQEMGKNVDEKLIKNQIIQRDEQDRKRPYGALQKADDAVYLDSSDMTKKDVIDKIVEMIKPLLEGQ